MKISPACKAAAKIKYKVWPSAYASGYGVKCTKAGGPKMKSKTKGGGTTKACLPAAKVASMSKKEKDTVIRAKRAAGKSGKRERSDKSNVKGARKKRGNVKRLV